ncbi:hypothetical protein KAR91_67030 [Candidatus Pacearchaeota archaeon]|nr:hypothetical protein [Candidatus Pacearchaeota archaeon]
MISDIIHQFERVKNKRQTKRDGDEHQYEDYFLTDDEIAHLEEMQRYGDTLIRVFNGYGLTATEVADALMVFATIGAGDLFVDDDDAYLPDDN